MKITLAAFVGAIFFAGACDGSSSSSSEPQQNDAGAEASAGDSGVVPDSSAPDSGASDSEIRSDGAGGIDASAPKLHGTVWYVRKDGGDRTQCNGKADVAYPGSGTNQSCAFDDPRYLYTDGSGGAYSWLIAGGDSVVVRDGPWRIGQDAATGCSFSNDCAADGSPIPPIPAGTPQAATLFYGEHYANCSTKTQLFGGYTVNGVFDLRGTHDVQVNCLELTDHSQCTRNGSLPVPCNTSIVDDYAKNGVITDVNTHDVTLEDVDIHGFEGNGVFGPVGGTVTAIRVRVAFNGSCGWEFDDGNGTKSVNGQMNWSSVTIEGNGCVEEFPIVHAFPAGYCYDDNNGGYGDGVGTPDTTINFAVDHSTIRYNTQDGLDVLHTTGSQIAVTDSLFYGNMGQQLKVGPMAAVTVQNNLFLTNCARMSAPMPDAPSGYNAGLSDFCRANAGLAMVRRGDSVGGGKYVYQNNDFVGYAGDAMFEVASCTDTFVSAPTTDCNTPNIVFQNNLMVGSPYVLMQYHYGELPPSGDAAGDAAPFSTLDHNIYYDVRICPTEPDSVCTDPHVAGEPNVTGTTPIAESLFDAVTFKLTTASTNAIGKGIAIPGLTTDYAGSTRPNPPSIGAYEAR
jgi:hypothetical protein